MFADLRFQLNNLHSILLHVESKYYGTISICDNLSKSKVSRHDKNIVMLMLVVDQGVESLEVEGPWSS